MLRRAVILGMAATFPAAVCAAGVRHPETVFEFEGQHLVEGIAFDGRQFYLGTINSRWILIVENGRVLDGMSQPLLGVFGIALDQNRNRLWAATARLAEPGRSELVEFNLATKRILGRYKPGVGHPQAAFGDLAIGLNGDVFVSDSKGGAILRLRKGATSLETLVPPGTLKSPQGMVVRGRLLIVADYSTGLHQVDLASGSLSFVEGATIRGVDGLMGWRGDLIAIQNGASTPRIIRISLPAGELPGAEILYEGGVLIEPTLGTVVGDKLFFIGRSQWGEADAQGGVPKGAGPTRVMSLALPA
jgi:hypothetical protein